MDYDEIGKTYTATRRADPRITAKLIEVLGLPQGSSLIDVGAGTGNYSSALAEQGFMVTALEPSQVMHNQRKQHDALHWVKGVGEDIPFDDDSFDGAVMTLCLHHLQDWEQAIKEVLRVCGGGPGVIFAFDIEQKADFWLFDYFPTLAVIDQQWPPALQDLKTKLEAKGCKVALNSFPLPKDLIDHFAAAGWARPSIYLDESYRRGISSFTKIEETELNSGIAQLEKDLSNGAWESKNGHLLKEDTHDRGYKFVRIES